MVGGTLFEWNQNNQFQSHKILGRLSIDQGWIVLDKSGAISNTTIGSIYMVNVNSILDFHSGSHPGSFTVNTDSITNIGGEIHGLFNGNGNVSLNVTHNVTNLGNVQLIYNAGVNNLGNGNATLNVGGKYKQTNGDTRGVFNLSITNAGTATMTFGSLEVTGGLMMVYYACNTTSGVNKLTVSGDMTLSMVNINDKFRINGITSLAGYFCNSKAEMLVGGNLNIGGIPAAEFTSSGSVGLENVTVKGNVVISGMANNFNYGGHASTLSVEGDFRINGGYTYVSRFPGAVQATINKDVVISSGILAVKGSTGVGNILVKGSYVQSGGTLLLHSNTTTPTNDQVALTCNGAFSQVNGIFNYDANMASTATHSLTVKGSLFSVDGTSELTRSGAGVSSVFGVLNFSRQGIMQYKRNSSSAIISQIKQVVNSGCTVDVAVGDFLLSSHSTAAVDFLQINASAVLQMHTTQISSALSYPKTGFTIEAAGKLATQNSNGFFNTLGNATVKSIAGMDFFLNAASIIEYNASSLQVITGAGTGVATGTQHNYGVLMINHSDVGASNEAKLVDSKVFVRTKLVLQSGGLNLNGKSITIENNAPTAVERVTGFIKATGGNDKVIWKNISSGSYVIPFGESQTEYVPLVYTPISGSGDAVFTSYKSNVANEPVPSEVEEVTIDGKKIATTGLIDRWFIIKAPGLKADIAFSFEKNENTTTGIVGDPLSLITYQNKIWKTLPCSGDILSSNTSTVNSSSVSDDGAFALVVKKEWKQDYFDLTGYRENDKIILSWTISADDEGNVYEIERSTDEKTFSLVKTLASDGKGIYEEEDLSPFMEKIFYRIKSTTLTGVTTYSSVLSLESYTDANRPFMVTGVSPNPFDNFLQVNYNATEEFHAGISLVNANGQAVYSSSEIFSPGINTYTFNDRQRLPKGIYLFAISSKYGKQVIKVLKK